MQPTPAEWQAEMNNAETKGKALIAAGQAIVNLAREAKFASRRTGMSPILTQADVNTIRPQFVPRYVTAKGNAVTAVNQLP